MNIIHSKIFNEVKIFEPKKFRDSRGFFTEVYNNTIKKELKTNFIQDNLSLSNHGVIRGIHYQFGRGSIKSMGKLCRVITGSGFSLIVDLRSKSNTFGLSEMVYLSSNNLKSVWVPEGFGHAFISLDDNTYFYYKCSSEYNSDLESSINIYSPKLQLNLPLLKKDIILSDKDMNAPLFSEYELNPKM